MRTVTPAWPRPEFLDAPQTRPVIAWLWVVAASLACVMAANDWLAARDDLAAQRERLSRVSRQRPAGAPRPRPSAASGPAEADALRAARAVVDRIAHPWDGILANVEAETPAGLQWLQLDHDADDTGIRLEGAAPDVAGVLKFVDGLSDRPGWSDVVLGRLHAAESSAGGGAAARWRFELRASIDAGRVARADRTGER